MSMHTYRTASASGAAITAFVLCGFISSTLARSPDDACTLLTQAQVAAALATPMDAGVRVLPNIPRMCGWSEPGGATIDNKRVTLTLSSTRTHDAGKQPYQGITKTPVGGIGDDAYYVTASGLGTTLNVKKGVKAFSLSVKGKFTVDQVKAMEKTLALEALAKL
jgi:hypothetical protein